MTTLILVRHGESAANGKGCFAGQLDIPLSERGREQAVRTAEYIAKTYSVDKIYSSDLSRAYDTAKPIAKAFGLEIIKDKNLREICSGDWQGLSFDELQEKYADSYGVWLKDIGNAVCPNGETVKILSERVFQAIERIANENEGKTIVITTHATPIRTICCKMKGLPVEELKNVPWVSNASVSVVTVEKNDWKLSEVSIDEHLKGLQTRFPANV